MSLKFVATGAAERKPLPAGVYPARLADVERRERDGRGYLLWLFVVAGRTGERKVFRPSSTSFGRGATARAIVEALLGREVADGEEVDVADLLDLPCRLVLATTSLADGRLVNRVQSVLPVD